MVRRDNLESMVLLLGGHEVAVDSKARLTPLKMAAGAIGVQDPLIVLQQSEGPFHEVVLVNDEGDEEEEIPPVEQGEDAGDD